MLLLTTPSKGMNNALNAGMQSIIVLEGVVSRGITSEVDCISIIFGHGISQVQYGNAVYGYDIISGINIS